MSVILRHSEDSIVLVFSFFLIETRSYVAEASLELLLFLPPLPKHWY